MRKATAIPFMHSYPGMVAVITSSWQGRQNVMAAGWHSYLSIDPPMYGIAVGRERFSYRLIKESGVFGVQFLPAERARWIQLVGANSGRDVDKFAAYGISWEPGLIIDVPILTSAYVAYECQVVDLRAYGDHDWFAAEIVQFYRDDHLFLENGLPDFAQLAIPLYLGRSEYAMLDATARREKHYGG
jgi:flavin reductase (DIM6/NTAB) family NADH-FMN oxidoreductase RutF